MSEMSKKARADMRAKANRLANAKGPDKVDSSDWSPGKSLNADRKTGARPIRARIYKYGGTVQGDRGPKNASRTPRASGGALSVTDTVGENKREKGSFHEGGYKKGGRAERAKGGKTTQAQRNANDRASIQRQLDRANAPLDSRASVDYGVDKAAKRQQMADLDRVEKCGGGGMNKGGRTKRADGGKMVPLTDKQREIAADVKASTRDDKDLKVLKRKNGGRAKGKTNINIIIGNPQDKPQGMLPQVPVRPPVAPPPPPPGPPPGGPPPMAGPPPGPPPGMGPPMGGPGMPPPMMRRSGGRTVHMTAGAGSGLGRLEKTAHAKADRRKQA